MSLSYRVSTAWYLPSTLFFGIFLILGLTQSQGLFILIPSIFIPLFFLVGSRSRLRIDTKHVILKNFLNQTTVFPLSDLEILYLRQSLIDRLLSTATLFLKFRPIPGAQALPALGANLTDFPQAWSDYIIMPGLKLGTISQIYSSLKSTTSLPLKLTDIGFTQPQSFSISRISYHFHLAIFIIFCLILLLLTILYLWINSHLSPTY